MRLPALAAAAALLCFSPLASAQTTPVSFSPEFQEALDDDLGAREGEILSGYVDRAIAAEFARRGLSSASAINVTIVDADPNRPTMEQLSARPGLDYNSISIGGAELVATLPNGETVTHRRYNHSLSDLIGATTTWSEARRAIRQFAVKVADAYAAPR